MSETDLEFVDAVMAGWVRDPKACYVRDGHLDTCVCPVCLGEELCPCSSDLCRARREAEVAPKERERSEGGAKRIAEWKAERQRREEERPEPRQSDQTYQSQAARALWDDDEHGGRR